MALHASLNVDRAGQLGLTAHDASDAFLVAQQAGTDVITTVIFELVREIGVGDELASELNDVRVAALEQIDGCFHRMAAAVDDRHGNVFSGFLADVGRHGVTVVNSRIDEIQVLIARDVNVERVHAGLFQDAKQRHAVLKGAAAVEAVIQGDAEEDRELRADDLADRLHDLTGVAGTVFQSCRRIHPCGGSDGDMN